MIKIKKITWSNLHHSLEQFLINSHMTNQMIKPTHKLTDRFLTSRSLKLAAAGTFARQRNLTYDICSTHISFFKMLSSHLSSSCSLIKPSLFLLASLHRRTGDYILIDSLFPTAIVVVPCSLLINHFPKAFLSWYLFRGFSIGIWLINAPVNIYLYISVVVLYIQNI